MQAPCSGGTSEGILLDEKVCKKTNVISFFIEDQRTAPPPPP